MEISGFEPCSLIDYPGKVACVVYTQACNFQCPYCYNKELMFFKNGKLKVRKVLKEIESLKDKIEAVVITGGEPTLWLDYIDFIQKVKAFGLLVKLDTNGSNPEALKKSLPYIDFIAMDIKAPKDKYRVLSGSTRYYKCPESIELIKGSGIPYQFRTTYDKKRLSEADIKYLKEKYEGLVIQECKEIKQGSHL